MRRRALRAATAILLAGLAAGCVDLGGRPPDAGAPQDAGHDGLAPVDGGLLVEVAIAGMAFRPKTIEIPRGTTVRWTNYDAVPHTVTEGAPGSALPPQFGSALLNAGGTYELRFDELGEWLYFCMTHPNFPTMRDAVVRVR